MSQHQRPAPHITLAMRSVNSVVISGVVVVPVRINEDGSGQFVLRTGISEQRPGGGGWDVSNMDQNVVIQNARVAERQRSALVEGKMVTIQGYVAAGWVFAQHIEWNGTHKNAPTGGAPATSGAGGGGFQW